MTEGMFRRWLQGLPTRWWMLGAVALVIAGVWLLSGSREAELEGDETGETREAGSAVTSVAGDAEASPSRTPGSQGQRGRSPRTRSPEPTGSLSSSLDSAQAMSSAMDILSNSGLLDELPEAVRLLSTTTPADTSSTIERSFAGMIDNPSDRRIEGFQEAALTELLERRMDQGRAVPNTRVGQDEPERQLALRLLIAAELARASGHLSNAQSDTALTRTFDALGYVNQPDLQRVISDMLEKRIGDEPDHGERALATMPADEISGLSADRDKERTLRKALLSRAMEIAARAGRRADFELYARRYRALPIGRSPAERSAWQTIEESEVRRIRALMDQPGGG